MTSCPISSNTCKIIKFSFLLINTYTHAISIMQVSNLHHSCMWLHCLRFNKCRHTLSHAIQLKPTCTGGLVCAFSALLESIATLLRLDELKRLLLDPPPIVRMLLVPKLWLLLRLAFRLLPAPTPGFLEIKIKSFLANYNTNYPRIKKLRVKSHLA